MNNPTRQKQFKKQNGLWIKFLAKKMNTNKIEQILKQLAKIQKFQS